MSDYGTSPVRNVVAMQTEVNRLLSEVNRPWTALRADDSEEIVAFGAYVDRMTEQMYAQTGINNGMLGTAGSLTVEALTNACTIDARWRPNTASVLCPLCAKLVGYIGKTADCTCGASFDV